MDYTATPTNLITDTLNRKSSDSLPSKQGFKFSPSLFIISGPSGVGKTTLIHAVAKELFKLHISVSYTTRLKRPDEQDGIDYHFISHETFKKMHEQGLFLEDAGVFGECYGTSRVEIEEAWQQGSDVALTIDCQGARQIREKYKDVVTIFILPPSPEILLERLNKRHQDSETVIQERMKKAMEVMSHWNEYDYLIVNEKFDDAVVDLKAILRAHSLSTEKQKYSLHSLIQKLLDNTANVAHAATVA
jgi:guanylate kinase